MQDDLYTQLVNDRRYLEAFSGTVIIGVAGTNGAGKDSLMKFLQKRGFLWCNTSNYLREISRAALGTTERGGNDSPMGQIGNAERRRYPGGAVELGLIDWWARVAHLPEHLKPRGLVIGSIRGMGEMERIKSLGGKLVAVDADRPVRYLRITKRLREDEQGKTYEQFCEEEDADLAVGQTDPTKFSMAAVIASADITIYNNGSAEEFFVNSAKSLQEAGIDLY